MLRIAVIALVLVAAAVVVAPAASANNLVNQTCESHEGQQFLFGCSVGRVVDCVERAIGSGFLFC